jgi:hypothetical protein
VRSQLGAVFAAALMLTAAPLFGGSAACAGEGLDATLVVDTGSSEQFLCVALDAESVSGIHLIELASEQHGLSYSLGYGGQAVCMLAGVGSSEEECFEGGEPFWGYWRSNGSGWSWSGSGAGSTVVEDGDVEGWSWGTGNDGASHQAPTFTSHEKVCGPEGSSSKKGGDDEEGGARDPGGTSDPARPRKENGGAARGDGPGSGRSQPEPSATAQAGDVEPDNESKRDRRESRKSVRHRRTAEKEKKRARTNAYSLADPSPSPSVPADAAPSSQAANSAEDAPPTAGIVGLGGAIVLGLVGAWFLKRRHLGQT